MYYEKNSQCAQRINSIYCFSTLKNVENKKCNKVIFLDLGCIVLDQKKKNFKQKSLFYGWLVLKFLPNYNFCIRFQILWS